MKFFTRLLIVFTSGIFVFGCANHEGEKYCGTCDEKLPQVVDEIDSIDIVEKEKPIIVPAGMESLIDIQKVDPSIRIDLKYATEDNFMKKVLYHDIHQVYLQKDVAERLAKCQSYLKKIHPDYTLLVYDGARPLHVQQQMWDGLDTIPVAERGKFVSNPANGSIHNYGAAVDLTICDENGTPLDMGAGYDDIRKIAYPSLETQFLASGELTEIHIANRKLLRKVMASQRFTNIPSEWWHFNACSRARAKELYGIVK
jgi:D-alanyl-D-alanine dipeptidase